MQLADDVKDLLNEDRSEAHGRLVEHQELRLRHERSAHGEHLLLAAGERTGDLLAALFEAREALVDVRNARFNGGVRLGVSAHFEVILDRHLQKDVAAFRNLRKTVLDDLVRGDAL